jgi:hypothetical protein
MGQGVIGQSKGAVSRGFATVRDIEPFEEDILRVAPELRGASCSPLGEGMDNRAVLIADKFVFRFPKHPEAAERLLREVALLPRIAPRLDLPIPHIKYVGQQASTGYAFTGHQLIRGVPLPSDRVQSRQCQGLCGL